MQKHEEIFYIEPERLVPFHNHPFRVTMDEDMEELIDSIRSYGIITPLIVRPTEKGSYRAQTEIRCHGARAPEGPGHHPLHVRRSGHSLDG